MCGKSNQIRRKAMKTQKAKSIPNAEHCMVLVMQKESINTSVKY